MAVNALGQTLQLLLNQAPNNDLSLGLKAGDLLQGRILDILPDNRAILQIKGFNMVAQLPAPQAGQQFSKGALLDLAVLQAQTKPSQGAVQAQAPALTVKLLGISSQQAPSAAQSQAASPLPQPTLEALLSQAKLPVTAANLTATQSLLRYGLPVDAQTLNSVIQSAEALIAAEGSSLPPLQQEAPALPAPVTQALSDAKTLLSIVASQPGRAAERPQIQALIRQIDELLVPGQNAPISENPPLKSWTDVSARLNASLNQVSDARPQSLQNFSSLISGIKLSLPSLAALDTQIVLASARPAEPEGLQAGFGQSHLASTLNREVSAFVSRQLAPAMQASGAGQAEMMAALSRLSSDLETPQSPMSDSILNSAARQLPAGTAMPLNAQALLKQSVAEIKAAFSSNPLSKPVKSQAGLASEFEARGVEAPRIALSDLHKEIVVEAVAFLKARQIPLSRPAIEAVASQLESGSDLGQQLNQILDSGTSLPQPLLEAQPKLKHEFQNLRDFFSQNAVRPEAGEVATQISDFVRNSGLNLERDLAETLAAPFGPDGAKQPLAPNPADSLKAGLLKLRDAVQEASRHSLVQANPELAQKLESLGGHISAAINGMHTLQMASQPTPAFDVTSFQIPVFFGGQMQSGQLSIYWKKGRPHELGGQDPVNVVFLLNTRGLGEVKVQLQVWKSECRCKVSVASEEARKFIQAESAGLEKSFSEQTPFRLSSLDISAAMSPLKRALDFVEDVASRNALGLNLTA